MSNLRVLTAAEQVADHLRLGIENNQWGQMMPGGARLTNELGVGRMTVEAALRILEQEGLLVPQGPGRRRRIQRPPETGGGGRPSFRVGILLNLQEDRGAPYVLDLHHEMSSEGYTVIFAPQAISQLGEGIDQMARMCGDMHVDAWVIVAGSRKVLEWFAANPTPAMAMFGRARTLPVAWTGPDKPKATREVVEHLLDLGHRRIVLIARPMRRLPQPGLPEQAFLQALEAGGIRTGAYHLPDWDGTIDSLHACIDSLFQMTPPTALLIDEPALFLSVQQHLARKGILAPDQVSLVCMDKDPYFEAQRPTVAHVTWDSRPWARAIIKWLEHVRHGANPLRVTITPAKFIEGGTVGPALR